MMRNPYYLYDVYSKYVQRYVAALTGPDGAELLQKRTEEFHSRLTAELACYDMPEKAEELPDILDEALDNAYGRVVVAPLSFPEWLDRIQVHARWYRAAEVLLKAEERRQREEEYEDYDEDQADILRLIDEYEEPEMKLARQAAQGWNLDESDFDIACGMDKRETQIRAAYEMRKKKGVYCRDLEPLIEAYDAIAKATKLLSEAEEEYQSLPEVFHEVSELIPVDKKTACQTDLVENENTDVLPF